MNVINKITAWKESTEARDSRAWFLRGMKDGIPIGMGYFAVSFTIGIAAKKAGLTALQAALMSVAMHASAGQFAAIGMITAGAGYMEMVITELVVNLRYMLMSSALSQKVRCDKPFFHRFLMAYDVTDEIFGIAVAVEGKVHPSYLYGAMAVASPGWVLGTLSGALLGMIMPERMVSALNVALYGMFMAVVVPAAKKSRIIGGVMLLSMGASTVFATVPMLNKISSGFRIIILTILVSGAAALLFPVKDEREGQKNVL